MVMSRERRPASTCATAISSFLAVSVQARVEFTSPTTDHQIGALAQTHRLEGQHDARRLLGVGSGADLEIDVRFRHAEILEEGSAHVLIVMLTGMNQQMVEMLRIPVSLR